MYKYFKVFRVWQWAKNLIIFIPTVLSSKFSILTLIDCTILFFTFSIFVSGTYIFNDIKDVHLDLKHPEKKLRPIASGDIKLSYAKFTGIIAILVPIFISILNFKNEITILFILYLVFTVIYSYYSKYINFLDSINITILFLLRLMLGSQVGDVLITRELFLFLISIFIFIFFLKKNSIINKNFSEPNNFYKLLIKQNLQYPFYKILYFVGVTNIITLIYWGVKLFNFVNRIELAIFLLFIYIYIMFLLKLINFSNYGLVEDFVVSLFSKDLLIYLFFLINLFFILYF